MRHTLKTEWIFGVVGGVLAAAALGLGRAFGKIQHSSLHAKLIGWAAALALIITGAFAIVHLSRAIGRTVARQSNIGAGASIRLVASGLGFVVLIFGLLTVLGVSLDHLLIGAGVAGIILGVAAQQSLGNVFAAIVMLFARPFVVGDRIRIRSGVTGVIDVRVLGIGLTYVTVMTDDGVLKIPNSIMLGSGIGQLSPGAPPPTVPAAPPTPPGAAAAPSAAPAPASSVAPASSATPSPSGTSSRSTSSSASEQIEEETP
jgi:small-conductance mechanosensitive channel